MHDLVYARAFSSSLSFDELPTNAQVYASSIINVIELSHACVLDVLLTSQNANVNVCTLRVVNS
jgi:hypothetical protein